jgi:hypothetical protein
MRQKGGDSRDREQCSKRDIRFTNLKLHCASASVDQSRARRLSAVVCTTTLDHCRESFNVLLVAEHTIRHSEHLHIDYTTPVKSIVDLSLLNREVKRRILDADQFPDDIRELWYEVEDIQRGKHMIPIEIKDEITKLRPRTEDCWWSETPDHQLSTSKLLRELDTMVKIRDKTLDFNSAPALEASWDGDVHSVMLRQVTKRLPGIEQENVTAVRLDTTLIPKVRAIDAESKLVDFALIADETLIPPKLVKQVLADTRNGITSISHATYERVRFRPICVSIETKTPNGKESIALVQLSLWATTHFNPTHTLTPISASCHSFAASADHHCWRTVFTIPCD